MGCGKRGFASRLDKSMFSLSVSQTVWSFFFRMDAAAAVVVVVVVVVGQRPFFLHRHGARTVFYYVQALKRCFRHFKPLCKMLYRPDHYITTRCSKDIIRYKMF